MPTRTRAVVPINWLKYAKSRLRQVYPDRRGLVLEMLTRVVSALVGSEMVDTVMVVSPDGQLKSFCDHHQIEFLRQNGSGLNEGLEQARRAMGSHDALLVALGDLPLLEPEDVRALLRTLPGVSLAPDLEDRGTNLCALQPGNLIPFCFGPGSFERFCGQAKRVGAPVTTIRRRGTAFDLDHPHQLRELPWLTV